MTRSEISAIFGRNTPAPEIDRAITVLMTHGRIEAIQETTGGRPATRYRRL
jgi:hypothetical protein